MKAKRGQGNITVNDTDYFYSFGTRAIRVYSEVTGKNKNHLINMIAGFDKGDIVIENADFSDILYSGLVAGARIKKGVNVQNPGFDQGDVDDIVDLLEQDQINQVLIDLMRSIMPPEGLEIFEKAIEEQKKSMEKATEKPKAKPKAKKKAGKSTND